MSSCHANSAISERKDIPIAGDIANNVHKSPTDKNLCADCARIDFEAAFDEAAWDEAANARHYIYLQDLTTRSDWDRWQRDWVQGPSDGFPPSCWFCEGLLKILLNPDKMRFERICGRPFERLVAFDRWYRPKSWYRFFRDGGKGPKCWAPTAYQQIGRDGIENAFYISAVPATPPDEKASKMISPLVCVSGSGISGLFEPRLTSHFVDFDLVKTWIQTCNEHHPQCLKNQNRPTPHIRLIDCVERRIIRAERGSRYVALSYVWGSAPATATASSNTELGDLPRTIADAILVTLNLGYRYLWVDRYCIRQDDESDKMEQIQIMDQIYECAVLTIIAAAGTDDNYGLPGVGKERIVQTWRKGPLSFAQLKYPEDEIEGSIWNTRGWTFQESILSHQRLMFTESSAFLQCEKSKAHELLGYLDPTGTNAKKIVEEYDSAMAVSSISSWRSVMVFIPTEDSSVSITDNFEKFKLTTTAYSKRNFTYRADVFHGLRGISRKFEKTSAPIYNIFGIPFALYHDQISAERFFVSGLSWHWERPGSLDESPEWPHSSKFPTWSWAKSLGIGIIWGQSLRLQDDLFLWPTGIRFRTNEHAPAYTLEDCIMLRQHVSPMLEFHVLEVDVYLLSVPIFLTITEDTSETTVSFWAEPRTSSWSTPVAWLEDPIMNGNRLNIAGREGIAEQLSAGSWGMMVLATNIRKVTKGYLETFYFFILEWEVVDGSRRAYKVGRMEIKANAEPGESGLERLIKEHGVSREQVQIH
ncbi:hypothetical protein K456DRAFT_52872 [Colletotrichum gloeosporioides 23]|nr:hypothetical protein K456DRAFT_52872 [Colletotrichum gloeosporioides 23]